MKKMKNLLYVFGKKENNIIFLEYKKNIKFKKKMYIYLLIKY